MRTCSWCGTLLVRRDEERPSAFLKRQHCTRSCQVRTQNRKRARENKNRKS